MDKSLYVAMTGAQATLHAQATVANNLANANTHGFKQALTHTTAFPVIGPGYPVRIDAVLEDSGFDRSLGAHQTTGNALDIALRPGYWLAVQSSDGSTAYTRNGHLSINSYGQLITEEGHVLVDENNNPLALPPLQTIEVGNDGTLSIIAQGDLSMTAVDAGKLYVIYADDAQLQRGLDGLMRSIEPQQELMPATGHMLDSGMLETSNVNPSGALVQMIQLQRQFEMQVKLISHGDENSRNANSLLRLTG